MKGTMTVLLANGGEEVHHYDAPIPLEDMQKHVGGYIETVPMFTKYKGNSCVAFCNEEGKLNQLPFNHAATSAWAWAAGSISNDVLVGNVIIIQGDDEFMEAL